MLRLRIYAHICLKSNNTKTGIYLLTKSLFLYPTLSGLKTLLSVLFKVTFKYNSNDKQYA